MKKNSNINIRKLYIAPEVEILGLGDEDLMDITGSAPDQPWAAKYSSLSSDFDNDDESDGENTNDFDYGW